MQECCDNCRGYKPKKYTCSVEISFDSGRWDVWNAKVGQNGAIWCARDLDDLMHEVERELLILTGEKDLPEYEPKEHMWIRKPQKEATT